MMSLRLMIPMIRPGCGSSRPATTTNRCTRFTLIREKTALKESLGEQVTTPVKSRDRCFSAWAMVRSSD